MSDLIRVEDLRVAFSLHGHALEVVKGASFRIKPGTVVALVGESGSGKSVISQSIMGILPNSAAITGGRILFNDEDAGISTGHNAEDDGKCQSNKNLPVKFKLWHQYNPLFDRTAHMDGYSNNCIYS